MFTDIHSHVIYGVDDGASKREAMEKMLTAAAKDGIDTIISTSHVTPGERPFDDDLYKRHIGFAREYIDKNDLGITLHTGAQILYTPYTPRLLKEKKIRTLAGTRFVLIQFYPDDKYERLLQAARDVGNAGYSVIFAHIERYHCLYKQYDRIDELKHEYNVYMQMNARTVFHKEGFFRRKYIDRLLKDGLIDFVATDTHDMPGRNTCMTESYQALKALVGQEQADALTRNNQQMILKQAKDGGN